MMVLAYRSCFLFKKKKLQDISSFFLVIKHEWIIKYSVIACLFKKKKKTVLFTYVKKIIIMLLTIKYNLRHYLH